MRTYVWPQGGIVFRRVKHFSGYQVIVGFTDTSWSSDALSADVVAYF
jgi:hypothetical protein